MTARTASATRRGPHPFVYLLLIIPFGATSGYLSVTMGYLAGEAGVGVDGIASLIAWGLLPHTFKALWAPVIDLTLSRKRWYVIGSVTTSIGLFALSAIPLREANLGLLSLVAFTGNLAVTVLGMAVDGLMAYNTSDATKGRAAGWFQAGNLGGAGLGGGLGLLLAQHLEAAWMPGAIVSAILLLCALALLIVPDAPKAVAESAHGLGRIMRDLFADLWGVLKSRPGIVGMTMCILPMGTGAAANLFPRLADVWGASPENVEIVNGTLGGLVSAVGCLFGGLFLDRMNRRLAYALAGAIMAAFALGMAISPRTPAMYVFWVLLYNFGSGLAYAAFSGFVLEAIGRGAAATKYNIFASVSNLPIYYMTRVLGGAAARWGSNGMLWTEAGAGVGAIGVLLVLVVYLRSRPLDENGATDASGLLRASK